MKKLLLLILLSTLFLSGCGGSSGGSPSAVVNAAPTLASISNQSMNEDTTATVTLVGSDAEGSSLTYSATSSTTNVSISISSATITLSPAANWNGTATISAYANDGAVNSATETFTLTVTNVNDAPVLSSIGNQTTPEDNVEVISLVASDADASDALTYSATSSNVNVTVSISGAILRLSPAASWNGTATITAKVNDGTVDSANKTFTLTAFDVYPPGTAFNGKVYLVVTSPKTGRKWLDRNLGATRACNAFNDSACFGYLYQGGRNDDGHELLNSTTINTSNISAGSYQAPSITPGIDKYIYRYENPTDWTSADSNGVLRAAAWANTGINDICPPGYSVPTKAEVQSDIFDYGVTDRNSAYGNFLKLPSAGYRGETGHPYSGGATHLVHYAGTNAFFWTRTLSAGVSTPGLYMFGWGPAVVLGFAGGVGSWGFSNSVRCIKDL